MSPRTTFINELNQLKENVADMATRVEKNYETLFEAYEKKEKAAIEKSWQWIRISTEGREKLNQNVCS